MSYKSNDLLLQIDISLTYSEKRDMSIQLKYITMICVGLLCLKVVMDCTKLLAQFLFLSFSCYLYVFVFACVHIQVHPLTCT